MPTIYRPAVSIISGSFYDLLATDSLILDAGIVIASTIDVGVIARGSNSVTCNGTIASVSEIGLDIYGGSLNVGSTGTISGENGVWSNFNTNLIATNRGLVLGTTSDGVSVNGSANFTNYGTTRTTSADLDDAAYYLSEFHTSFKLTNFGLVENKTPGRYAILAEEGNTSVDTITNNGTIKGNVYLAGGNDIFDGTKGKMTGWVDGGVGNDKLFGSAFADTLFGNDGNDTIRGGLGRDLLTGDNGADDFVYTSIADSKPGATRDVILDFTRGTAVAGDDIHLTAIDAKTTVAGNQNFTWRGTLAFTKAAGQLRFTDQGTTCLVQGDVNGDGKADFEISVKVTTLGIGDFIL
ncbi:MAG TPA: hypothetical protein VMF90_11285 [Rhizobiaceae bacterium]|nr:hypothetical protein [Rhizobiaceae bacterium]